MIHSRSQRGISLIEILIALALSILIILAMLRAFVTTGAVTSESSAGAKADSSMMLGFIAADRILQGMGFGLSSTSAGYGTNFQVLDKDGSPVAIGTAGKYLVWKSSDTLCQALYSHANGLYLYGKSAGYACTSLAKPADDTTPKELLIAIDGALRSSGISNNSNNIGNIDLKVESAAGCVPFGAKNGLAESAKYQAVLTAKAYAASSASVAKTISNVTCLFNFK